MDGFTQVTHSRITTVQLMAAHVATAASCNSRSLVCAAYDQCAPFCCAAALCLIHCSCLGVQLMSKGYIQSAEKIRDRLLISEWELSRKLVAKRRQARFLVPRAFSVCCWPGLDWPARLPTPAPRDACRGVGQFEKYCAEEKVSELSFEMLTQLYQVKGLIAVLRVPVGLFSQQEPHAVTAHCFSLLPCSFIVSPAPTSHRLHARRQHHSYIVPPCRTLTD